MFTSELLHVAFLFQNKIDKINKYFSGNTSFSLLRDMKNTSYDLRVISCELWCTSYELKA